MNNVVMKGIPPGRGRCVPSLGSYDVPEDLYPVDTIPVLLRGTDIF
jgi:hypothetical protein